MSRAVWRFRLVATCLVLTASAFLQDPGRITAADTKLDLTANPWGFLGRALHLWDDQAFFGQLQNQAYGYCFPMGPFFGVLTSAGLPAWVAQRLWWSVLLCAAFLGAVRLARLLGITSPGARWVAGLAFALAPRVVSTLGPISSETLVVAIAPWVLIPLVLSTQGAPRWTPRRAGAVSAVAVLFAGGVNAVATAAALVLPALWLLTRRGGPARRRLVLWWAGCVALASLWWVVPLLTLGSYSPPFLDWIESASVTTGRSDVATVLRWRRRLGRVRQTGAGGPSWPAGWRLVTEPLLILLTGLVATAGLTGLAVVRRERRFVLSALLVGLVLTTLGHTGVVQGIGAPALQQLLDGVLAPLRNTHKFDVVIRLPLALGLGWFVMAAAARLAAVRRPHLTAPTVRRTSVVVAGLLVVGAAWPLVTGGITRDRSYESIPGYWNEVADWLASDDEAEGTALVVPGAPFGVYLWGRSQDEPLQPLASSPWAVRDAVPLSSAGNIRLLDRVEALLTDGRGDPYLAPYLARMGVTHLVVRNDLDPSEVDSPRPSLVHASILASGGFTRVGVFGPFLAGYTQVGLVADAGVDGSYPAVEIFRVDAAAPDSRAVVRDATAVDVLHGESESVLGASGLPGQSGRALVRAADLPDGLVAGRDITTDTARRIEVAFGRVHDNRSSTLDPDAPWTQQRGAHDYTVTPVQPQAAAGQPGGVSIAASSSRGDATAISIAAAAGPWNAVDDNVLTAWLPRTTDRSSAWWEISRDEPFEVTQRSARPRARHPGQRCPSPPARRHRHWQPASDRDAADHPGGVAQHGEHHPPEDHGARRVGAVGRHVRHRRGSGARARLEQDSDDR